MEIKDEIEVVIEDAKFIFECPTRWDFKESARLQKAGQELDDDDFVFSRLKKVENLTFKGDSVTPEGVRECKLPLPFVVKLKQAYWKAFGESLGLKATEEKKENGSLES